MARELRRMCQELADSWSIVPRLLSHGALLRELVSMTVAARFRIGLQVGGSPPDELSSNSLTAAGVVVLGDAGIEKVFGLLWL